MMTAISTAVVSQRSPVDSSAMNVMVSGPPITETDSAPMPTTAYTCGSSVKAGERYDAPSASMRPASAPSSSEAKNNPPRNPDPSETIEASALSANSSAIIFNG